MNPLDPLTHALAAVLAAAHTVLSALGAAAGGGLTWLLAVAALVVVVRLALLPFAVHAVRQAHASARARSQLRELRTRYAGRRDPDAVRALLEEQRRIHDEHGISRWGCLPLLVQLPIWWTLYHLVSQVADSSSVGAMSGELVASFAAASLLGVPLVGRGYVGGGATQLALVAGLAVTAAALSFATQRLFVAPNTLLGDLPEALVSAHQLMPLLSAAGLLVAGGFVPVALLAYWVCNGAWTLGQSAVVWRWFPTPGTPAHARNR
jgi:YidC/Oxa1 family membrane protein insertase